MDEGLSLDLYARAISSHRSGLLPKSFKFIIGSEIVHPPEHPTFKRTRHNSNSSTISSWTRGVKDAPTSVRYCLIVFGCVSGVFCMLLIASSSTSLMFRLSCPVGGGSEQVRSISVHIRHTRSILEPSGSPQLRYIPECIPALVESLCFFLAEDGHLAGLDSFWIL